MIDFLKMQLFLDMALILTLSQVQIELSKKNFLVIRHYN